MKIKLAKLITTIVAVVIFSLAGLVPPASAQAILPQPDPEFNGDIDVSYKNSTPDTSILQSPEAPEGAPNIVLVLLDDVGFSSAATFGGPVKTDTLDKLASEGLSYTRFHTTSLCSPTRAAMLTGRNHQSAANAAIEEIAVGYPGYTGRIPKSTATIAQILQDNGYSTAWFGKNHNAPDNETSMVGPFDRWPNALGFDYFYGFISGETDQWYPALYENLNPINPPATTSDGKTYNLGHDLADKAITWMRNQHSIAPDRPFFLYFAPGATHAPHQPPEEYRNHYDGVFDNGWDDWRNKIYKFQQELGVIPIDDEGNPIGELTDRPDQIPAWDSYDPDYQEILATQMEIYAAFLEYTDDEVGRVIDAIPEEDLDNTMIIYIVGDNGAAPAGSEDGVCNELKSLNGLPTSKDENIACKDNWGMPGTSPEYAVGWAWATDAPFRWTKKVGSYFGGTRNPMVIKWPAKISNDSTERRFRNQFHHVIDIAPTILEVAGIEEPFMVNSIQQKPIEGVSLAYTFDDDKSKAYELCTDPTDQIEGEPDDLCQYKYVHNTQYFEMYGNRGIYKPDGENEWMASTLHRYPFTPTSGQMTQDFDEDTWELFDLATDFTQATDLSADNPDKLENLKELFMIEGSKYNVFPLDDRFSERGDVSLRPSFTSGRDHFEFYEGAVRLPEGVAPDVKNTSHDIIADVNIPDGGADGVLLGMGGEVGGYTFYVKDNKLNYTHNYFGQYCDITSTQDVPTGDNVELKFTFNYDEENGENVGGGGTGTLFINGTQLGQAHMDKTVPARYSLETQDVGMDLLSPTSYHYDSPFEFTGTLNKLTMDILSTRDPQDDSIPECQWTYLDGTPVEQQAQEVENQEVVDEKAEIVNELKHYLEDKEDGNFGFLKELIQYLNQRY
ncbi:arylsulfatase [Moorena sp. SIO3B2]|uniref:arylsulfatase n=1 Tax=Moorena sp. SIO3B2 TaxID=2607827 RepID=UPI0013C9C0AA|nr:arylsulfatase [Moorena sp. SIO3B2]NEP35753.1 arylsulfatase [Moorena sp. SIO3B2]